MSNVSGMFCANHSPLAPHQMCNADSCPHHHDYADWSARWWASSPIVSITRKATDACFMLFKEEFITSPHIVYPISEFNKILHTYGRQKPVSRDGFLAALMKVQDCVVKYLKADAQTVWNTYVTVLQASVPAEACIVTEYGERLSPANAMKTVMYVLDALVLSAAWSRVVVQAPILPQDAREFAPCLPFIHPLRLLFLFVGASIVSFSSMSLAKHVEFCVGKESMHYMGNPTLFYAVAEMYTALLTKHPQTSASLETKATAREHINFIKQGVVRLQHGYLRQQIERMVAVLDHYLTSWIEAGEHS